MPWRGRKTKAKAADGEGDGPFFGMSIVATKPAKKGQPSTAELPSGPTVGLLSLPWDHSSSYRKGAVKGPRVLREVTDAKLYNPFTEDGTDLRSSFTLLDLGEVGAEFRKLDDFETFAAAVEARAHASPAKGPMVFLGGDHACTYATVRAMTRAGDGGKTRWGLVYLDAHPDLYVNYAGTSNSHACPVRRLIDEDFLIGPNVVEVGVRAGTPSQKRYAEQKGVRTITAAEFMESGATKASELVVRALLGQVDAVYVSLDLDVLDPAVAPGVGNPEPGGLSVRDLITFLHGLAPLPIRAVDVMEYNPLHDPLRITGYAAAKYLKEALGLLARAGLTA